MDVSTRALTGEDASAFADLAARIERDHRTNLALTAGEFVEFIGLGGAELEGAFDDEQLVAWSGMLPRAPHADGQVIVVFAESDPERGTNGLRSFMARRALVAARARHETDAPTRSLTLVHRVASDHTPGTELATRLGFAAERYRFNMVAELGDAPAVPVPDGYELVGFDPADSELLRAAQNAAFADYPNHIPVEREAWNGYMVAAQHVRPRLSWWLRAPDGTVASYLFTHEYQAPISGRAGDREAYVPFLGTLPAHRRRGLAGMLLRHALHSYAAAGYDTASLEVDAENPTGALGMYERAGFRAGQRFDEYYLRES